MTQLRISAVFAIFMWISWTIGIISLRCIANKGIHSAYTFHSESKLRFYVALLAELPEIGENSSSYSGWAIIVRRAVSRAAASIIFLYGYCDRYHCLVDRILFEYGYDPPFQRS